MIELQTLVKCLYMVESLTKSNCPHVPTCIRTYKHIILLSLSPSLNSNIMNTLRGIHYIVKNAYKHE